MTATTVTGVLLKVTGQPGKSWWESLGLPPPWKWGDDRCHAYVVNTVQTLDHEQQAVAA